MNIDKNADKSQNTDHYIPPLPARELSELIRGTDIVLPQHITTSKRLTITTDESACTADSILVITKKSNGAPRAIKKTSNTPYAIVFEQTDCVSFINTAFLVTANARKTLAVMASNAAGISCNTLKFVGVTGTNGKTTTATMIHHILTVCGYKCGFIGTGKILSGESDITPSGHTMTTPDPLMLYAVLANMQHDGCTHIVMEVSSHALALDKTAPLQFDVGIFTNLSAEHLDMHGNMESYFSTKKRLFDSCHHGIFCIDDSYAKRAYKECTSCIRHSVGVIQQAETYATDIEYDSLNGESFYFRENGLIFRQHLKLIGTFNIYNALLALKCSIILGIRPCEAKRALSTFGGVDGRMLTIRDDIDIVIDYAHTPFAIENVLKSLVSLKRPKQRLITVFGCGGERDRSKRAAMGCAAAKHADLIILTEDNSRSERTEDILSEIAQGISNRKVHRMIPNRKEAIYTAICDAKDRDIVAILGKGHEKYIIDRDGSHPFDEREIVTNALSARKQKKASTRQTECE